MSLVATTNLDENRLAPLTVPLDATPDCAPLERAPLRGPLGQQLLSANLIASDELEAALSLQAENGQKLGEVLLELGFANEEQLLPFIESQLGVTGVRLREGLLDPIAVRVLPRNLAQSLTALSLFKINNTLIVATDDPLDLDKIDRIERFTGLDVQTVFCFQGRDRPHAATGLRRRFSRRCGDG